MIQQERLILGLSEFGKSLEQVLLGLKNISETDHKTFKDLDRWSTLLDRVYIQNAWFTREQLIYALEAWIPLLRQDSLRSWVRPYPKPSESAKTVALILAGNIPLVGFHDLLSVLLSGNRALVKYPTNDGLLLPFLISELENHIPGIADNIMFTAGKLTAFDAVIATGSNNTSRYFEYYFASKPHIIRKNRNSVAVLFGNETTQELSGLAMDIFRYFGMGCRSVSKLFVPQGYDFEQLFQALFEYKDVIHHQKYANNYDYNKAVYLMSGAAMLDNGFLLLKEDSGLGSPIGTLFYETFTGKNQIQAHLKQQEELLQCVVGSKDILGAIPFGSSQYPSLTTYADGIDTLHFLMTGI